MLPRVAKCGRVVVDPERGVDVHRVEDADGPRGATTGVMACGSVWACPVCSAHIRQERANEIEQGARLHQDGGGGLAMLTLTLQHGVGERLVELLDGLLDSWRRVVRGSPWQRKRQAYGILGTIKTVEVTWGQANGWHPHLHVLLVSGRELQPVERVELEAWLFSRWQRFVVERGLGQPTREHGVRLDVAGRGAGRYVAKVQERSLSLEMTRGDLKHGRHGRLLPFDLLWAAGNGERDGLGLWWEYEEATRGRRAIVWSPGLRDLWGLGQEREDLEIVEDDATSEDTHLVTLTAREWQAVCAEGLDYEVIAHAGSLLGPEVAAIAVRLTAQRAVAAEASRRWPPADRRGR